MVFFCGQEKEAFYLEHIASRRNALLAFCRRVTNDPDEAEDAAQHALELAWEKLEQLDDPRCAESWLFSIARRLAYRELRQPVWDSLPDEDLLPRTGSAEDEALAAAELRAVIELMRQLPLQERQAVYGCCVLGMTPAQLARRLQVNSHTVSARLYRGRKKLRKMWEELR